MSQVSAVRSHVTVQTRKAIYPAILAVAFGLLLVLGTGLAGSATIHEAAHDARHAFAFPCH